MKNLYLTKGRLIAGLVTGILFFLLFGYLALNNPQQKPEAGFVSKNWPRVILFVIAPMLIHAGTDLMIIIPVFATYGVSGR